MERLLGHYLLSHLKGIKSYYLTDAHLPYDAVVVTNSELSALIEIKVRDNTINQYPDYILEVEKLDKLVNAAKAHNNRILYINFFKTEVPEQWDYIIFNITARLREWEINGAPTPKVIYANEMTYVSKEKKKEKWVITLKYEPDKDEKGSFNLNKK
jgi:hypothetical protein